MQVLIVPSFLIVIGILLLMWGADIFVRGSVILAKKLNIPTLLIGIVIIGFGTSAPELIVSATSAFKAHPEIAIGNAYGSNIVNIGLILGITALISPILVQASVVRQELPILIFITLLSMVLIWNLEISRIDSALLIFFFILIMGAMIWLHLTNKTPAAEITAETPQNLNMPKGLIYIVLGLLVLILSSDMLVKNAIIVAHHFGVSDLVIGLTIIAIGTSLPELASSIAAALKGENALALGNIIGSNIFNTLAVVGVAGLIHQPFTVAPIVLSRDLLVMLSLTVLLLVFCLRFSTQTKQGSINRIEGLVLLSVYVIYTGYLFISSSV